LLTAGNALAPAVKVQRYAKRFDGAGRLQLTTATNAVLLRLAAERRADLAKTRPLVSPGFGGTQHIGVVSAILLGALLEDGGLEAATTRALATLEHQNLVLRRDDQPVATAPAKRAYLTELMTAFVAQELPLLMAAGIVEATA
jgi:hypothetical protein